jgi:hypothetical protein
MKGFSLCPRGILFNLCGSRGAQKQEIIYLNNKSSFVLIMEAQSLM